MIRISVVASLTLLTMALLTPGTARAGCAREHGLQLALEQLTPGRPTAPVEPPEPRKPCTGALCTGDPAPAPTAPSTIVPPSIERWAILAGPIAASAGRSDAPLPEDEVTPPGRPGPGVFRPPCPRSPLAR